ncbi:MAG: hypothetical protein CSA50_04865 [Gammaproteobacteria bacterium]|nr:MAG: hypothetical protein CSA50_04865 [Gammaproteobacteria bacterium]
MKPIRHNTKTLHPLTLSAVTAATLVLSGCGGSSSDDNDRPSVTPDPSDNTNSFQESMLDATSYTDYTYFNLDTGKTVDLSPEAAKSDLTWHIGFRRNEVILNGGASGAGNVSAALVADQNDFYDSEGEALANVFLNATKESELEHLLADADTTGLQYQQDKIVAAIRGTGTMAGDLMDLGWYYYNPATHALSANPDNWWLLRSAAGNSYARFHCESLVFSPQEGLTASFAFDIQSADTSQFATSGLFTASIPAGGGSSCFDFDSGNSVDCSDATWDLKLEIEGRDWHLWINGGNSGNGKGGAFGPFTTAEANAYTSGNLSAEGVSIDSHYTQDTSAGLFLDAPWYGYNFQGRHQLWPNYRVYIIDTDTTDPNANQYKLQITNYYSDAGASGHPNIRYIQNQ